ncbi:hypothetical protein DPMN_122787 [Dreissena polymorpha]|uniref:Uncharacterized protein n=1 Tax=Dreissena polymorpha TaxID=45954 RepID=A0A9D4JQN8_DREPO|nr:hypothetical protein DPMN_122787 [Dreissena polymorpha]
MKLFLMLTFKQNLNHIYCLQFSDLKLELCELKKSPHGLTAHVPDATPPSHFCKSHETASATSMGLYQFTVMSSGLTNAPSTLETLMENVLIGFQLVILLLFMDNIISPCVTVADS